MESRKRTSLRWFHPRVSNNSPSGCFRHSADVVNNQIVVFGGFDGQASVHEVCVLDLATFTWNRPVVDLNGIVFRSHFMHTSNVIGDKIYIIRTLVRGDTSCVVILDTKNWRWSEARGLWPSRFRLSYSSCVLDEKIYVYGGMSEDCVAYGDIDVFDTNRLAWSAPAVSGSLPPPRHSHTATVLGRSMYVIGGTKDPDTVIPRSYEDLYRLDLDTMTWSQVQTSGVPPSNLVFHNAVCIEGDKICVLWGRTGQKSIRTHILDCTNNDWREVIVEGEKPLRRIGSSCTVVDKKLFLYGGFTEFRGKQAVCSDLHVLDLTGAGSGLGEGNSSPENDDSWLPKQLTKKKVEVEEEEEEEELTFEMMLEREKQYQEELKKKKEKKKEKKKKSKK